MAKNTNRCSTTAERMGATGGATAGGLTACYGHFAWMIVIPPRTALYAARAMEVSADRDRACLRKGKVARHCYVATCRLTSDARRMRFGSKWNEDDES
jgi:hypothetical protein